MSEYFPKPLRRYGENIKVRVDHSNYATKDDIKNITHVDTSGFALITNLSNLKTEADKLDIGKLNLPIPVDLSKLPNVVKNDVIKKTKYNKLVNKVNNIDTSEFILKTKYNADKVKLQEKTPDISNLATKTALTTVENKIPNINSLATKILVNKVENKTPDISNLATKAALTIVKNKISDINNLATKTALTAIENKIANISNLATKTTLTTVENKTPDISNLATKGALTIVKNKIPDISSLAKKSDYNTKITEIENNIKKLQAYDLSFFNRKKFFDEGDGKQNYLIFLPMRKYFKLNLVVNVIDCVLSWQSKGISNESIKPPITSDNSLSPKLSYYGTKTRVHL